MKRLRLQTSLSVLLFVALLAILAKAQDPAKQPAANASEAKPESWQKFSSTEGRFSVEFPGSPTHSTQTAGPSQNVTLQMYSLATAGAYGVSYFDSASPDESPDAAKKALDLGVQGMIKDYGPEQLSVSETVVEGYPGRLLTKRLANGYTLRVKMILVRTRQYQITCVIPKPEAIGADSVSLYEAAANRFLDSFKLISAPEELGEVDRWRREHNHTRLYNVMGTEESVSHSAPNQSKLEELNGRALVLPKPVYPLLARMAKAAGTVVVQVIADETGTVVAAQAISGHPLLYAVSVQAARESKFKAPEIDGKAVCFTGVIQYNFVAQ